MKKVQEIVKFAIITGIFIFGLVILSLGFGFILTGFFN
jgi:hypothetical protein